MDQILGSGAWTHAPRIVWGVLDSDRKYLGLLKTNIGEPDHVYPFDLFPSQVGEVEAYHAQIECKVEGASLSNYADVDDPQRGKKGFVAHEFLRTRLKHGPVPKQELTRELKKLGISDSTVQRAAHELGITWEREKTTHGPVFWALPDAEGEE